MSVPGILTELQMSLTPHFLEAKEHHNIINRHIQSFLLFKDFKNDSPVTKRKQFIRIFILVVTQFLQGKLSKSVVMYLMATAINLFHYVYVHRYEQHLKGDLLGPAMTYYTDRKHTNCTRSNLFSNQALQVFYSVTLCSQLVHISNVFDSNKNSFI